MSDERRPDLDNIKEFWRAAYMYVDDDDDDGALGPPSHYVATVYRYIVLPNPTFLLRHSIADFFVREGEIREKIHKDSNATWNIVTWEKEFIRKPTEEEDDDPLPYVVFLNKEQAIEEGRSMAGDRRDEIEENEKRKKGSNDLLEALDNLTLEETSEKTSEDDRRKRRWWSMDQ